MLSERFCVLMEQHVRQLRAYARSLSRNPDFASDLVQDALMKAWVARDQFQEGSNFKAWIFTILRNCFLDHCRRNKDAHDDIDTVVDLYLATPATQESAVHFRDVAGCFSSLTSKHREILMLVGAQGLNYDEASKFLKCAVGTVRSRLSRARLELARLVNDGSRTRRVGSQEGAAEFMAMVQA